MLIIFFLLTSFAANCQDLADFKIKEVKDSNIEAKEMVYVEFEFTTFETMVSYPIIDVYNRKTNKKVYTSNLTYYIGGPNMPYQIFVPKKLFKKNKYKVVLEGKAHNDGNSQKIKKVLAKKEFYKQSKAIYKG